jgi:hypothetical protein
MALSYDIVAHPLSGPGTLSTQSSIVPRHLLTLAACWYIGHGLIIDDHSMQSLNVPLIWPAANGCGR